MDSWDTFWSWSSPTICMLPDNNWVGHNKLWKTDKQTKIFENLINFTWVTIQESCCYYWCCCCCCGGGVFCSCCCSFCCCWWWWWCFCFCCFIPETFHLKFGQNWVSNRWKVAFGVVVVFVIVVIAVVVFVDVGFVVVVDVVVVVVGPRNLPL